jgi:hypothetical protein
MQRMLNNVKAFEKKPLHIFKEDISHKINNNKMVNFFFNLKKKKCV